MMEVPAFILQEDFGHLPTGAFVSRVSPGRGHNGYDAFFIVRFQAIGPDGGSDKVAAIPEPVLIGPLMLAMLTLLRQRRGRE